MKKPVMPKVVFEIHSPYWLHDNKEQIRQKIVIPSEDGDEEDEEESGYPTFPLTMQMFKDFGAAHNIDPDKVKIEVGFGAFELELYFEGDRVRSEEELEVAKKGHAEALADHKMQLEQYKRDLAQYEVDMRNYAVQDAEQKLAAAKKAQKEKK